MVSKTVQSPPIDPQNPKTPVCCGSTTDNVNPETKEAGVFERDAPGGLFKVYSFCNIEVNIILKLRFSSVENSFNFFLTTS